MDIAQKYDPWSIERLAKLHTLDALEAIRKTAAFEPTDEAGRTTQREAKRALEYYEKLLFPNGPIN